MFEQRASRPLLLAGVAVALVAAAPAMASEGPTAPPPPWSLTPPSFAPPGGAQTPAPSKARRRHRPRISRARLVPRKVRSGRRVTLRLALAQSGRVKITITRLRPHRRVTTREIAVHAGKVAIRLPRKVHGKALAPGRYRVRVVAMDAVGGKSRAVRRTLVVRPAHR